MRMELLAAESQQFQVNHATTILLSTGLFNAKSNLEMAALAFYNKLVMADCYQAAGCYHGNITLIRAEDGHEQGEDLGEDYGLNEVNFKNVIFSCI